MDEFKFGISIGTSKVAIIQFDLGNEKLLPNHDNNTIIPSFVHYQNQQVEKYGQRARDVAVQNYKDIFFDIKSLIGQDMDSRLINTWRNYWSFSIDSKPDDKFRKVYYKNTDETLMCPVKVLSDLLKSAIQNESKVFARIACSSTSTLTQKMAFIKAVEKANIKFDILLPKPIAGMISYHNDVKPVTDTNSFVFIFGGGNIEAAVVQYLHSSRSYRILMSNGDSQLGGKDFDLVIARIVKKKLTNHQITQNSERESKVRFKILKEASGVKEALSTTENETFRLNDICQAIEDDNITRLQFREGSEELIQRIRNICMLTLNEANSNGIKIDRVILFGMSSSMSFVNPMMREIFGTEVSICKPMRMGQDFARGAALSSLFKVENTTFYSIAIQLPNEEPEVIFNRNVLLPNDVSIQYECACQNHLIIPMTKKIAIGIDLGTTNSAVGIWNNEKVELVENNEGSRITPSCAYYSSGENYVGRTAMNKCSTDPQNVFFDAKRLLAETIDSPKIQEFKDSWPFSVISDSDSMNGMASFLNVQGEKRIIVPPEKVSADVLRSLLNDVCRRLALTEDKSEVMVTVPTYLNADKQKVILEAVVTVPAYFNTAQKRATLKAATAARIAVKQILSEPVAAALAYQMEMGEEKLKEGESVFIFDLGGGTFDVTIMKIEKGIYKVIALGGDTHLGGRDFEQVVAKMIEERLRRQLGKERLNELLSEPKYRHKLNTIAHNVKEAFSQTEAEVASMSDICSEARDEEITRVDFEENTQGLRNKIRKCCTNTLEDAGIDPKYINHALTVGGASRMKLVHNILRNIFPEGTIAKSISGDEAIAKGATLYAAKLLNVSASPVIKNINIQDALPLSIGVEFATEKFNPVLKNNSALPVHNEIHIKTTKDKQTSAVIPMYEGLSEYTNENTYVGDIEVSGIPAMAAGNVDIKVKLELDESGTFKAQAYIPRTSTPLPATIRYKLKFDKNENESRVIYTSNKKYAVGIDLGTTNSAIGVWHHEEVQLVENAEGKRVNPSCVYYSKEENFVGRMAINKLAADPENVFYDAKRFLGEIIDSPKIQEHMGTWPFTITGHPDPKYDKVHFISIQGGERIPISPEKVSADILKSMLKDMCRRLEVKKEDLEAVITVPAYFNITQKRATLEAAQAAGIKVKRLLSEPVAAALCYQMDVAQTKKFKNEDSIFVFDLGGGTFDVAIMKMDNGIYKTIALGGDPHLGGRDFDLVIARMIERKLRRQLGDEKMKKLFSQPKYRHKLMKVARDVKESLSTTESEVLSLSDVYSGAEDENKEMTREEFETNAHEAIEKIRRCCEDVLSDANMDPKDINYVFCVGGASKMPFVGRILKSIFSSSEIFNNVISADESIAKGATMYAARLLDVAKSPIIKGIAVQDALPISVGIEVAGNKFHSILKQNTPIPSSNTITLRTSETNQRVATIPLYEGLSEDIYEDRYLGEIEVKDIPPRPAGDVSIVVTLSLDMNGILEVEAKIQGHYEAVTTKIDYELKYDYEDVVEIID